MCVERDDVEASLMGVGVQCSSKEWLAVGMLLGCLKALPLRCSLAQDRAVVMVVVLIAAAGLEQNCVRSTCCALGDSGAAGGGAWHWRGDCCVFVPHPVPIHGLGHSFSGLSPDCNKC